MQMDRQIGGYVNKHLTAGHTVLLTHFFFLLSKHFHNHMNRTILFCPPYAKSYKQTRPEQAYGIVDVHNIFIKITFVTFTLCTAL
jgi:hypothetical protein